MKTQKSGQRRMRVCDYGGQGSQRAVEPMCGSCFINGLNLYRLWVFRGTVTEEGYNLLTCFLRKFLLSVAASPFQAQHRVYET